MSEIFVPLPDAGFPRTWRLGVTSYVYPANLETNLRLLAGHVQDIELVLFDTPQGSNFPSPAEVESMAEVAAKHDLTWTVHFPIDHQLGSADRKARGMSIREMTRLIALLSPLKPHAYITHLEGIQPADPVDTIRAWQRACAESIGHALETGVDPQLLCIENLGYPYEWNEPLIERLGLGICIDIGHLWLNETSVRRHMDRYLHRARAIHLHGESNGEDHISLSYVDDDRMETVMEALVDFKGSVTLEMFEQMQVRNSILRLAEATGARKA